MTQHSSTSVVTTITEIEKSLSGLNPLSLLSSDFLKNRFIRNHEMIYNDGNGELAFARQSMVYAGLLKASKQLQEAPLISHFKCFIHAGVNDWSLDPADQQCYIVPYGSDIVLQPQAGTFVAKLIKSGQITKCEPAKLVYQGDTFIVKNGKVIEHIEKFETEKIIAGYVVLIRRDGSEAHFIYRPSDWNAWKAKSKMKDSENWSKGELGQPVAAFLKTKIVLHACKEKCWHPVKHNLGDSFPEVVERIEDDIENTVPNKITPHEEIPDTKSNSLNPESKEPETQPAGASDEIEIEY